MGDRFVVGFRGYSETDPIVFYYSHWGGSDQQFSLDEAIHAARGRWSDPSYATRIAISHLVGEDWRSETGSGVWAESSAVCQGHPEGDYPIIYLVDWGTRSIIAANARNHNDVIRVVAFDEFDAASMYDSEGDPTYV